MARPTLLSSKCHDDYPTAERLRDKPRRSNSDNGQLDNDPLARVTPAVRRLTGSVIICAECWAWMMTRMWQLDNDPIVRPGSRVVMETLSHHGMIKVTVSSLSWLPP
jgi:hypothetical protein